MFATFHQTMQLAWDEAPGNFDESLMKILNGWDLNQMDYKPLLAAHL